MSDSLLELLFSSEQNLFAFFIDDLQHNSGVRTGFRRSHRDGKRGSWRKFFLRAFLGPTSMHEIAWIGELAAPMLDVAFFILHIEINLGVRVRKAECCHRRLDGDWVLVVVRDVSAVMGEYRN